MPRLRFVSSVQGVSTIELNEPIITVGRVANNVVCIEDPNISKHHTLLVSEDDTYKIYDLHSVNGTWVNGERVTVTKLKEGDAVRIGYLELKYELATPSVAPRPNLVAPAASKTATGPTTLAARPRLGLRPPGPPPPVVGPAAATATHAPVAVVQPLAQPQSAPPPAPAPVKEEKRLAIQLPPEKKITGPTTPPPVPVASAPAPTPAPATPPAPALGGPPKLKVFGRPTAPPAPTPPPAPAAAAPEPEPEAQPEAPPAPEEPPAAPAAPPPPGPKRLAPLPVALPSSNSGANSLRP